MEITGAKLQFKETRTVDVVTDKSFEQLLLAKKLIQRMKKAGFIRPTPVQTVAIPVGLLGNDMLVQAKSGTGKTLVFAALAANCVTDDKARDKPQVVILAPTHEIASQIKDTIDEVAFDDPHVCLFIGGVSLRTDKESVSRGCDVAVGTPGKIAQLTALKVLDLSGTRLLVLDEADKLMEKCFTEDIKTVYRCVNSQTTQVAVFSATYPMLMDDMLCEFMKSPILVKMSADVQLIGIYQYAVVALGQDPVDVVDQLLSKINNKQAIVFTNNVEACQKVCKKLVKAKHKAEFISRDSSHEQREKVFKNLKRNFLKVLVSTDLIARGVDAPNVSVVINMGPPTSCETYFHRIGRAGRFGGNGVGITVLSGKASLLQFMKLAAAGDFKVKTLSTGHVPPDLTENQQFYENAKKFDNETVAEAIKQLDQVRNDVDEEWMPAAVESPVSLDLFAKKKFVQNPDRTVDSILKEEKLVAEPEREKKEVTKKSVDDLKLQSFGRSSGLFQSKGSVFQKHVVEAKPENVEENGNLDSIVDKLAALKVQNYGKSTAFQPKSSIFQKPKKQEPEINLGVYSREEMMEIRDSRTADWVEYAKANADWQTAEEPFEFDPELKCSVETKIRILRERGKAEFKKKVQEAKEQDERRAREPYPGILEPIIERSTQDPGFMQRFLSDVEHRSKQPKQKTFEDKSCQAEILVLPTEVAQVQTIDTDDFAGEEAANSEDETCSFEEDEVDSHIFTSYARVLLSGMKLHCG